MRINIIIIFLILFSAQNAVALRNPFEPQLPKKEEVPVPPPVQKTAPAVTEETSKPDGRLNTSKVKTQPPAAPTRPELFITGIIWNSPRPQAIINGQVVDVGDVIGSVKVLKIEKTGIDFEYNGEVFRQSI